MRIFYFFAEKISYTYSLVFLTVLGGWMGVIFGYYLGTSFVISHYEQVSNDILKWTPLAVFIPTCLHYLQFGLLTRIGIPAFQRSLRHVNRNLHGARLNPDISNDDLQELYVNISDLPMINGLSSVFYSALVGILLMAFIFYDYYVSGMFSIVFIKIVAKVVSIAIITVILLYGISTYLITEIITSRERASCFNELRRRKLYQRPRILISLRVKFSFFIILMFVALLAFAALMQRSIFFGEYNIIDVIVYISISVTAGLFLMSINTNSILNILHDMDRVTREISSGEHAEFRLHSLDREFSVIEYAVIEMADEIDEYRKNMEQKVEQRTEELQNVLADLKERDDMIQKQLDMASLIQRSILPGQIDEWLELKFSVRYVAMEKIGGDFYDVYQLRGNKIGILVADVSGHGIPAALVTTMAKIAFNNASSMFDSPRRIFQEVNQNILDHVKTQDYLTAFFVVIDEEYNVTFANASHQKAMHLKTEEGVVEQLDTNGLFIGAIEDARDTYEEKTTKLNYGDKLVLYTDGIPEAINLNRQEYSIDRLEEVILKNRHLPVEEFTSFIIDDVQRFIGGAPVEDDITLVVIEMLKDEAVEIIKSAKKLTDDNKFYEAIDHLEKGLSLYRGNRKILYNLAKNYFRVNNYGKTVEYISLYLESDKKNKFAYYLSGAAYYQMMDYKNAIIQLEKSVQIDQNFSNAHFALGMAYLKQGMNDDARMSFERVLDHDPDNKMAQFELMRLRNIES